jgi:protein involved in ribonucleotide reduction
LYDIVYFSNVSGNTKKFVKKLDLPSLRIPLRWEEDEPLLVSSNYVLFIPTYGGGNDSHTVPKQVVKFLNIKQNRDLMVGVVGFGNTNFGEHYCKAAEIVAAKIGVPLLYRVEIFGTPDDVNQVTERLHLLWTTNTATTSSTLS